jgi:hypothetical protein
MYLQLVSLRRACIASCLLLQFYFPQASAKGVFVFTLNVNSFSQTPLLYQIYRTQVKSGGYLFSATFYPTQFCTREEL